MTDSPSSPERDEIVPSSAQRSPRVEKRRSLLQGTMAFGSMTFLSRIAGFARDVIVAQLFGAGAGVDAFIVAFKIPNFMRRLFGEGAFTQAFVPILSEYRANQDEAALKGFVARVGGTLSVILLGVVVVGVLAAPLVITVFAPGFLKDPTRFALAVHMLRLTFPYLFFICLVAFSGAILACFHRFAASAFTPVLFNLVMIAAAVWFRDVLSPAIYVLAWGVFVAGVVQWVFQYPFLKPRGMMVAPKLGFRDPNVRRVLKLMVPALFGVSVSQINLLLDTFFASFLPVGSVSWLYFSERLMSFPLGIIGVGLATVALPTLSRSHATADGHGYGKTLDWALRLLVVLGIPAALGLFMLSYPLEFTLFHSQKFTTRDAMMAGHALMAFSVGVPFFMAVKVLASGFYARQELKTPVKIATVAMVSNMVFNLLLIKPFAHVGLATATTLAGILNAGMLGLTLIRQKIYRPQPGWGGFLGKVLIALTVMGVFLFFSLPATQAWPTWTAPVQLYHLGILIGGGATIYFAVLWLLGMRYRDLKEV